MEEEDKALTFCFYAQFMNHRVSLSFFLLLGGLKMSTKSTSSSQCIANLSARLRPFAANELRNYCGAAFEFLHAFHSSITAS